MNSQRFPQITIPKPCHEDWSKMTPDERGAYCSVCSKSVWDFTAKSPDEVKAILMRQSGENLCGRFRHDQLAQPVELEFPIHLLKGKSLSPLTKFAVAAFVVFGTALFSCTNMQGQMVGKIKMTDYHEPDVRGEVEIKGNAFIPEMPDTALPVEETLTGDTTVVLVPEYNIVGAFVLLPEIIDTADKKDSSSVTIENLPTPALEIENQLLITYGIVSWSPPSKKQRRNRDVHQEDIVLYPQPVDEPVKSINLQPNDDEDDNSGEQLSNQTENPEQQKTSHNSTDDNPPSSLNVSTFSIFPNPTNGMLKLIYSIPKEMKVSIEVYDLNGKLLQRLAKNEQHHEGEYSRTFDVSSLPSGTYVCVMEAGEISQTVRFVKSAD